MDSVEWYFDFVSPFSYLQLARFDSLSMPVELRYRPVLLAGLLNQWGHKGPAEIPAKRRHTYRFCQWYAERNGVPLHFPPTHPFNSLSLLRLAIALNSEARVVRRIFDAIYKKGSDGGNSAVVAGLAAEFGLPDGEAHINDPDVKETLRTNTNEAIAAGVYGVPMIAWQGELFWGVDSTDLFLDYLADPERFMLGEYARLAGLPVGASRRR